jgi:prophage antirepressor-like protein
MRNLLRNIFGERSDNALIIHADGKDWVSSKSLCNLMGIHNEYNLVGDLIGWPEMNLTQEDKCKFSVEGAHLPCPIWFVSETGFWKIVARSHSSWAARFRSTFLPTVFNN